MTINENIKALFKKRNSIDSESDYELQECCNEIVEYLSLHIEDAIQFLKNECSGPEFVDFSEVAEQIALRTQSQEFVDSLKELLIKYPEESKKYYIADFVNSAECMIGYDPEVDPEIKL